MRRLTILFLALCSSAFATTYYVDPQNTLGTSADTNNGTFKATAWVHAPGMTGCASLCASTTLNAGDSVIFRGGATIPSTYLPWTLPNRSGSSGSVIYYGVDPTWFVGGSFTRPIINGGNPLSTSFVGSCTVANSGTQVHMASTLSFVTFDNFEFTGFCWTGNVSSNGTMLSVDGGTQNIIVSNMYCHGWTMTSGASDNFPCVTSFGGGTVADSNQYTFDVFDGSDSPHFAAGTPISGSSPACQYSADGNSGITNVSETSGSVVTITTSVDLSAFSGGGVVQLGGLGVATWLNGLAPIVASSVTSSTVVFTDPTSHGTLGSQAETGVIGFAGCASGQGINGSHVYNVDHSIFRYLSNDIVTANCHSYHDNLFEYLYATFASGSQQQHPNVMNCIGGASGENLYWYNNTMRHTFATENVYFAVRTNLYYFNNVAYDNMNSVFGPASEASVCTRFNTVSNSTLPVNAYIYNNTDGDNSCQVKFEVANAPLTKWSGTGTFQNNHYGAQGSNCTGTCGTPLTGEYTCATSGTCTIVNNGTHVFQTTATETSQGYTSANMYQPTTGGSTISAGASVAAQCSVFSPDSALCSGTSAGVKEQAGNGGQIAVYPAVTINLRGTTWDAGAYDFLTPVTPSSAGPVYPNGQLHPIQQVNIFNGPLNQTGAYSPPQWSDYKTALTSVLTTGGVGFINEGCTKASCTNLVFLDAGAGTDGADWCPAPSGLIPDSTNGLDGSSGWIATTTANGNLANLVIAPASYGNNSVTPAGIFGTSGSPGWARKLDTNCSGTIGDNGGIYPLTWQPNHRYFPGQYVYDASTTAYWLVQTGCAVWTATPLNGSISGGVAQVQLGSTPAGITGGQYALIATSNPIFNAAYVLIGWDAVHQVLSYPVSTTSQSNVVLSGDVTGDAGCISGNALTFSGTSTPDGNSPNTFTWVKQADAPYQDSWVGPSYTGLANKAYSIPLASATDSCNGTTCTVTLSNAYIGTANVDHLTITGSNIAGINAANKLVTAIGATTVTYSNTTGSCNPNCSVTTGTLTATRNINMGMTNATIAVVQSGLPVPYEPPAYVANTYYCQWVFNHYAGNSKVGYIGCGGSIGGEDNTSGMTGTNGWRYGSEANYLGYQWQRLGLFHGYAKSANILLRGNIFLFTFQQAYADWAHSASLGTNGYQMNDALAILAGNCNVVTAVQADWCILFNEYYNLPYPDWFGTYPMLELQLGSQLNGGQGTSTPGLDNAGNTGSLGADPPPAGNANCVGCPFEGLMPLAKSLHATTMEIYDACDNFLAVDPAYPAGCSIVSGNADVTAGVVTTHGGTGCGNNCITYASIVAGNLVSIAGTACTSGAPCTVASVGASSLTLNNLTVTGVSNAALKTWADPALYQIASAAAFANFTNFGYQIAGTGTASFVWGGATNNTPPGFVAYTGTDIVQPPTVPNMGVLTKNGAVFHDTSYSSGTPAPVYRMTDSGSVPDHLNVTLQAGLNGSGSALQLTNANSTLVHLETNTGESIIGLFNPTTGAFGNPLNSNRVVTQGDNLTHPGSAAVSSNFGDGSFDWIDPTIWYSADFTPDTTSNVQIIKYIFNSSGQYSVGPILADYTAVIPINANAPAWTPATHYVQGVYVSAPFPAPDWTANHAYATAGDLIKPLTNNAAGCAFRVITPGTSGSSAPTWGSACKISPVTDGTVTWRGILAPPVFVYQLTSGSGTSGSTFTLPNHPDLMTTISDNGLTWTNVGPDLVPPVGTAAWESFAGVSRDGTKFCGGGSTNSYGFKGSYKYNADQGTGIWAYCYSTTTNAYYLLNTGTGWISIAPCIGGTGYQCTGGTRTLTPVGPTTAITTAACGYFTHATKGSNTEDYDIVGIQVTMGGAGCPTNAGIWQPFLPYNATTSVQFFPAGLNHWAPGGTHLIKVGQSLAYLGGFTGGAFTEIFDMTNPNNAPSTSWQAVPCSTSWVSGVTTIPPCQFSLAFDQHMSWAYNPNDQDNTPICGTVYNLATNNPIPVAPWQGEEVCVSTTPTWTDVSAPGATQKQWRFTHTFNQGTNAAFSVQFGISQYSSDGKWLFFGSDWGCTLGSTTGGSTSFCGPQWTASTPYTIGQMLNPFSGNSGSGTNFGVYQVTTNGTSATVHPAWFVCNSTTAGNTVTDSNGLIYKCLGSSTGRGDVFAVKLQ